MMWVKGVVKTEKKLSPGSGGLVGKAPSMAPDSWHATTMIERCSSEPLRLLTGRWATSDEYIHTLGEAGGRHF